MPKYIDIHSHVNLYAFKDDAKEVLDRALENDTWIINVGTQIDTSKKAVELAEKYGKGVYAIVGLHPVHTSPSFHDEQELGEGGKAFTSRGEVFDKDAYRELLKNEKVVAIGECGLDYYHLDEEVNPAMVGQVEKEKKAFVQQIELAQEFSKPLMLHIRNNPKDKTHNAYADSIEILKNYPSVKGDVHFFAGTKEDAQNFLDLGFYLSFTGVITFTHDYDEVIKTTPLDRIMSETDAPYVAPVPYRGKRNEPLYVREVVKKIAEIKGLDEGIVAEAILNNAKKLFGFTF